MTFLRGFQKSMETKILETKVEIEATNKKLDGRLDTIEEEVKRVNTKIDANDEINARINVRLTALEQEMKNATRIRRRSAELKEQEQLLKEQMNDNTPDCRLDGRGGRTEAPDSNSDKMTKTKNRTTEQMIQDCRSANKDKDTEKMKHPDKVVEVTRVILEQPAGTFRSSWARGIQEELQKAAGTTAKVGSVNYWTDGKADYSKWRDDNNGHDDNVNEVVHDDVVPDIWEDRLPKSSKQVKIRKPPKIEKWFGFDSDSDEADTDDSEWSEVDRKKRREEKKKAQNRKKREIEQMTAMKASSMIGIGPIDSNWVERHKNEKIKFEDSKVLIVKELLARELEYNEEELEELDIRETRLVTKGDGIIYMAMGDQDQIKEIYKRKAELKNDDLTVRSYIPPNYFDRFTHLNRVCKEKREEDSQIKTQIRFGKKDIEIFVKYKNEGAPFKQIKLEEFTDMSKVPGFDHSISWKRYTDKPPRRVVIRPAGRHEQDQTTRPSSLTAPTPANPLIRQHSIEQDTVTAGKKAKLNSRSSDDEEMEDDNRSDESDKPVGRVIYHRK